jgi:predicted transcriptional regulator
METDEGKKNILKAFGNKNRAKAETIAKAVGTITESVLKELEWLEKEGFVKKGGGKGVYWHITESGKSVIGFKSPHEKPKRENGIIDLIIEGRESLLAAFRERTEEILSEIRKRPITSSSGIHVPKVSDFTTAIAEEYPRLYVDSIAAVDIPELRRSIKVKLGIDSDVFDELVIKLVESGKYKIEEGSGDDGLRFRGRNFMFIKMKR